MMAKRHWGGPLAIIMGLWLALGCHVALADDWERTCPVNCDCKWYNNKKVADCSRNSFNTLPSSLSASIHVLNLDHNLIGRLPERAFSAAGLINLHKLNLANNRITHIHKDAFFHLHLVMDLDLSENQITSLHPHTFAGMEKMRKLILDGNFLSRLEAFQFVPLPNLHHLSVQHCRLNYMNNDAFTNLEKITSIILRGNLLKMIQPEVFMSRTTLRSVELTDNPWVCDCHLKTLIRWIQKTKMGEAELACHSPERLALRHWLSVREEELACAPTMLLPRTEVAIDTGGNATLSCGATGDPLPQIEWVLDGRLIPNHTELTLPPDEAMPTVRFVVREGYNRVGKSDEVILWSNVTVIQLGEAFMLRGYDQSSPFKCKVENAARMVERNVTLVLGAVFEAPVTGGVRVDPYVVVAAVSITLLVFVIVAVVCYCCCRWRRKKRDKAMPSDSKTTPADKAFLERNNILIVNPVEKPPRNNDAYEKLPQADELAEMTELSKGGTLRTFNDVNYPEETISGRVRSPLTRLEEEAFEEATQQLLMNESLSTTATTLDLAAFQYPDLLDNARLPRPVSPAQLSYHSLLNPLYASAHGTPDWRLSYVFPSDGVAQPPVGGRPGYVTLPRRPRTASVSSAPPSSTWGRMPLSPLGTKLDPIYDTLGPRTTADGTSRTDLSRALLTPPYPAFDPKEDAGVAVSSTLPRVSHGDEARKASAPARIDVGSKRQVSNNNNDSNFSHGNRSSSASPLRIKSALKTPSAQNSPNGTAGNGVLKKRPLSPVGVQLAAEPKDTSSTEPSKARLVTLSPRKVPPRPPPKPSAFKRASIASSSASSALQDEGPDGTEV